MDWRNCSYFWNPETGFVLIAARGQADPGRPTMSRFMHGNEPRLRLLDWDDPRIVAKVFIEFNTLVARDRIPIDAAHREFLKVMQYRKHIAPDSQGAEC
jgi:hypothetical protein